MQKGLRQDRLQEVIGESGTVMGLGMPGSVDNVEFRPSREGLTRNHEGTPRFCYLTLYCILYCEAHGGAS